MISVLKGRQKGRSFPREKGPKKYAIKVVFFHVRKDAKKEAQKDAFSYVLSNVL